MSIAKPTSDVSLGRYLTLVREDVGLNQAELAAKVGVSPATMSRIESGSKAPSDQEVAAILKAIGTQRARDLADYLRQDWNRLDRPPFDHPDLASLRIAELALAKLDRLREMPGLQNTFRRKADLYEGELRRLADFLALRTHPIAFIGTIGVGKSTAISSLTALENVLPTGAGRTTICEVRIVHGPNYGLRVEPRSEEQVRQDVEDFAEHLLRLTGARAVAPGGTEQEEAHGVSREVERAIRNMARLGSTRREENGKRITVDPARDLALEHPNVTDLVIQILARMGLRQRTRQDAWYDDGCGLAPLEWLKQLNTAVNNGTHPEFGLPGRIDLVVPTAVLGEKDLALTLIDTKGIDHAAARPDIECHFDDPRTLVVLCSPFRAAPDLASQGLLGRARDRQVRHLQERAVLLVLAYHDEAAAVRRDDGETVEDEREGYDVQRGHIQLTFGPVGLADLPVTFFNARKETPPAVRAFLVGQLAEYRSRYAAEIADVSRAVDELLDNLEKENVRQAFEQVERQLSAWINANRDLDWEDVPVQGSLVRAIDATRVASVVNASVVRQGNYPNLDYYHHLGVGAQLMAVELIGERKVKAFKGVVANQLRVEEFAPAYEFLRRLSDAVDAAVDAAYRNVQLGGRVAFQEDLRADRAFWDRCRARYGNKVPGYRDAIRDWTDEQVGSECDDAHKVLHNLVADEWKKLVALLERLLKEREAVPATTR